MAIQPATSGKRGQSMDNMTRAFIIIALTHIKRKWKLPINQSELTEDGIRQGIKLLKDKEFMGKPLVYIPTPNMNCGMR